MGDKLHIGEILGGKYRVDEIIGEGGMGVVVRATHLGLARAVAIKCLRPELLGNVQVVERFYREARAATRIDSPHSLKILDVGRTNVGAPFMVMELLEGEDLDHLVRRKGKISVELAVWLMVQACAGVADAHRMRIVHRDLKPSNLFLAKRAGGGHVLKVLDFGISRLDEQASQLTRTMTQLGTPHYMSPEQIERPKSINHLTDIWALGCILHRLVTGETAFRGKGVQVVSAVIRNNRKKPSEIAPELPAAVDAIVDKCLAPSPADRYQSADELAAALRSLSAASTSDSEPVITPIPTDEPHVAGDQNTIVVEIDHTLALAQGFTPTRESRPSLTSYPSRASGVSSVSNGFGESRTLAMDGAMDGARSSRPSIEPRIASTVTSARRGTRALGWAVPLAAVIAASWLVVAAFAAPGVVAKRAANAASRAGATLRYAEPRTTVSGFEVRDLDLAIAAFPTARLHARRARVSFSMDAVALEDVDVDLGTSARELARMTQDLVFAQLRTVDARNVHVTFHGADVELEAREATCVLTRADGPPEKSGERVRAQLTSSALRVTAFGVDVDRFTGRFDGTQAAGTLTASTSPSDNDGLSFQATYDESGFVVSARAPRQRVPASVLALTTFERESSVAHDIAFSFDAHSSPAGGDDAGETLSGALQLSVFGLELGAGRTTDLDARMSFHGEKGARIIDGGKARLGPFALTPSGTMDRADTSSNETGKLHASIVADSGVVPCAELRKARAARTASLYGIDVAQLFALPGDVTSAGNAHVALAIDLTTEARTPRLSLNLRDVSTCGIVAYEVSR